MTRSAPLPARVTPKPEFVARDEPAPPEKRGYAPIHTSGCRCPGCHAAQWWIGRFSAECAFCLTVLPLGPERRAA